MNIDDNNLSLDHVYLYLTMLNNMKELQLLSIVTKNQSIKMNDLFNRNAIIK